MSPGSRGRPPDRGRRRQPRGPAAAGRDRPDRLTRRSRNKSAVSEEETTDCWFEEPGPAYRRSWAVPPGHGIYRGLDLELLDPGDEDECSFLIEAQHPEFADALRSDEDVIVDGEPVNPRLHVAMHQVVANQLLAEDPPETWQTVQRLAGLGYDWHNIMRMIASLVTEDVYRALNEHRQHDPASYVHRLDALPGDWPPPEPAR